MMKVARTTCYGAALVVLVAGMVHAGAAWAGADEPDSSDRAEEKTSVDLAEIRARAETMPIDRRTDIDKRIRATVERINAQAAGKGQAAVAARLASEFSMTSEALLDEKAEPGFSWGEMVIAHTLLANSGDKVTFPDLVTLRSEGLGWGAIAFGLRFHLEDFEDAIKTEGKVAMGLSKADGKAAVIGK